MNNVFLIAGNIIKRALKNKMELVVLLVLPVAAVFITLVSSTPVKPQKISAGIVNLDKGQYGVKLINYIENNSNVKLVNVNNKNYLSALKNSKINVAVVIPEDFTSKIKSQTDVKIYFKSNTTNSIYENIKQLINKYVTTLYTASEMSSELSSAKDNRAEIFESLMTSSENSSLSLDYHTANSKDKTDSYQSLLSAIGFPIMFIMLLVLITIGTIMEDKKKLTIARMFTFKVWEWEIVAGNLLGSLSLGILQLIPVIIVIKYLFNLSWGLQIFSIFIILLCFIIATIGLGIGLSGIIKNNFNPSLITATVIFPTCLLGGCFVPESMLPSFIVKIGYVVPQKWVMKAIYQVLIGGNSQIVLLYLGIILMFALAFATFGVKTLKPLSE